VAEDQIEWHQGGEQPQSVEADGETSLPQQHAEVDRVAGKPVGPFATIVVVGLWISIRVPALRIVTIAQQASAKPITNTRPPTQTRGTELGTNGNG
jgi:hypothetical protein